LQDDVHEAKLVVGFHCCLKMTYQLSLTQVACRMTQPYRGDEKFSLHPNSLVQQWVYTNFHTSFSIVIVFIIYYLR